MGKQARETLEEDSDTSSSSHGSIPETSGTLAGGSKGQGAHRSSPGPTSLSEVDAWAEVFLGRSLGNDAARAKAVYDFWHGRTLHVTSKWCGCGGMHLALRYWLEELERLTGAKVSK
jgi:hypothetical protein